MKEFLDKTNALVSAFAADGTTTGGTLAWSKDGVNYCLTISVISDGASINASFSAYRPTPPPSPATA